MDQILVKLYVPALQKVYDVWIPAHKRIHEITTLLIRAVMEMSNTSYNATESPVLYDKITAEAYDINAYVKDTEIRNGTEVVLI